MNYQLMWETLKDEYGNRNVKPAIEDKPDLSIKNLMNRIEVEVESINQ